jgi:periplasmic protein TonB
VLYKVDPDYTPEPNAPEIEGTVLLAIVVGTDGLAHDIKIKRSQGEGPDKSAIAAVQKWKFQPGTRYGNPVNVSAVVEVQFPKKAVRPKTPGLLRISARFKQPG